MSDDDFDNLPQLPRTKRRKTVRREQRDDNDTESRSTGKPKKKNSKPRQQPVSTLIVVLIATPILWGVCGLVALMPDGLIVGMSGLVVVGLIYVAWGIGGVSLVVQEENETHGLICWSSLLLLLMPVLPCIALISLVGLLMVMFYGLTRIPKTALYAVLLTLGMGMLTFVGVVESQFKLSGRV